MLRPKTFNQKTIRVENRKKILQLLIREREITIPEISRKTRISVPTVTKNINLLVEQGIVEEAGMSESEGGRRPMLIRFLPEAYSSIGVEFALEHVQIILTNLDSTITARRILRSPNFSDLPSLMQAISQEVESILLEKGTPTAKILGIGFSVPGVVNEETKFLKIVPNLGLKNIDFIQYSSMFTVPLFVENDANAAAFAELTVGIAKTMRNLVYVSILPKGVGAGIVVEGHLYKGKNKRAGVYGHTTIASQGKRCSCGKTDCWEVYASGNTLLEQYKEKTGKVFSTVEEFFTILRSYEPVAAEVFDEYLTYLALGIQNIILAQDPHYVIIGGVLSPFEDILLESLQKKVFAENDFYDSSDVKIMCSKLKEDASILGASLLPFENLFSSWITNSVKT